jgi:hypothetical protein
MIAIRSSVTVKIREEETYVTHFLLYKMREIGLNTSAEKPARVFLDFDAVTTRVNCVRLALHIAIIAMVRVRLYFTSSSLNASKTEKD